MNEHTNNKLVKHKNQSNLINRNCCFYLKEQQSFKNNKMYRLYSDTRQLSSIEDYQIKSMNQDLNLNNYSYKIKNIKINYSSFILVLNLLLICYCLPVNSSNLNIVNNNLNLNLNNSTLNQLTSFNTYSSAIQIQYQTINETINFTHIAYDSKSGKLYIGAINSLLQLNSDLNVEQQFQTGPVMDSVQCSASSDCGQTELQLTPNIAKLLLIDNYSQKLIFCGSVKQGSCVRHSLNNVSDVEALVPIPVVANDDSSSTIGIIAPSTKTSFYLSSFNSQYPVMYVAATNSKLGPYRDMIPALCTRSLEPGPKLFNVLEKDISEISRLDLEFHLRDYYLVNYVYAFYTDSHIYFATTQPKSASKQFEELGYSSKLARLCLEDTSYNTYAEITLQCVDKNGEDYPLLQTAYLMDTGSDLKQNLDKPDDRVLLAVFTKSRDHTSTSGLSSAICLYSINDIERAFDENIRSCLNGTVSSRNMDYISNNIMECPTNSNENNIKNNDLCQETIKLNGSSPLVASSAIVFSNETLTAITGLTVAQHSVALVGTANGHLKKILISSPTSAHEFEDVQVDEGQRILPDLHIDPTRRFAFVASPYKIAKVIIERCQTAFTCRECLQTKNPYCGWCALEKKCTTRSDCSSPLNKSTNRWISMDAEKCIDFQLIIPDSLPIQNNSKIELVINQLPKLPSNAHYLCVFNTNITSKATITSNGLICNSPPSQLRPIINPDLQDHVSVELAIRSSETKTNFLSRNYTFYDCTVHKSCSSCLSSNWKCNWCMKDNLCKDNENQCKTKRTGLFNTNIQNIDSCPKIHSLEEIRIPNNVPHEIYMKLINLPIEATHSTNSLVCLVEYEQQQHRVPAFLHQGTIKCQKNIYTYKKEQGLLNARLSLILNKQVLLDKVNLTLYKCELLGSHNGRSDCSLCLAKADQYECGWCAGQCKHQTYLRSDLNCASQQQDNIKCPFPHIDFVTGLSGPIQGGSLVTINGGNLGGSLEEISITIGGVPCRPISYNVSVRVVCETGPSNQIMQEDILISNRAGYTRAREKFRYEQIEIYDIWPRIAPRSGGTKLYLHGKNLNVGTNVEVLLDDVPCIVDRTLASSQQINCVMPSLNQIQEQSEHQYTKHLQNFYQNAVANQQSQQSVLAVISHLKLKIDNLVISKSINLTYIDDPVIKRIYPLRTTISAGRLINVFGANLKNEYQPRMLILAVDGIHILNETICNVLNDEHMICPSPPINNQLFQLIRQEEQLLLTPQIARLNELQQNGGHIRLKIGFQIGNVQSVRQIGHHNGLYSLLTYVPDPQFTIFGSNDQSQQSNVINYTSVRYINSGESLTLQGIYLKSSNFEENEINITIGLSPCNITSYTSNQIICNPPLQQPLPTDEIGRKTISRLPLVVVRIGSFLRYELGYLAYNGQQKLSDQAPFGGNELINYGTNGNVISVSTHHHQQSQQNLNNSSLLFLLLSTCALIVICVCGLLFLRHKNSATEREYKKIQLQMDTLENQVRVECKQAFVELQTDMLNIYSKELQTTGMPTLNHRSYVMKVLFPGINNHPLLVNPPTVHTYQQISAHHLSPNDNSIHYHSTDIYNQNNSTSDYISYYSSNYEVSMDQFKQLLNNKCFLLLFINTLEQQRQFSIKDRVNVASLITIIFMDKMDYLTDILSILLYQFIEKNVCCNKHPQLMLRRTESVVEKLLANWLALHMYDYLRSKSGRSLFMLFAALKHQIEKGPIDAVSNEARYSLSEDSLLKENIDYQQIEIQLLNEGLIDSFNLLEHHQNKNYQLIKVNDCDTISQCKSKILDVLYRNTSYSMRPSINNLDLEWRQPNSSHSIILQDDDSSSLEINGWRRINTLRHYGVHSNALMRLIVKSNLENSLTNCDLNTLNTNSDYGTYGLGSVLSSNGQTTMFAKTQITQPNKWHLIKPQAVYAYEQTHSNQLLSLTNTFKNKNSHLVNLNDKISLLSGLNQHHHFNRNTLSTSSILPSTRLLQNSTTLNNNLTTSSFLNCNTTATLNHHSTKNIPEIYLTRLLATKGTTSKFVDDFLNTVLTVDDNFPQAIKWLFDLLDESAKIHGIENPSVVHAWKCNILPLRFWVNFVKNPELIFDIHKTPTIDSSLGVVAQLLMDICSDNDTRLGKDSPSNKLLFAKDLDIYKSKLKKFYDDIAASMPVTEHELSTRLNYLSNEHAGEFDSMIALKELFVYAMLYQQPIIDQLSGNQFCLNTGLLDQFKQIIRKINGQSQCS